MNFFVSKANDSIKHTQRLPIITKPSDWGDSRVHPSIWTCMSSSKVTLPARRSLDFAIDVSTFQYRRRSCSSQWPNMSAVGPSQYVKVRNVRYADVRFRRAIKQSMSVAAILAPWGENCSHENCDFGTILAPCCQIRTWHVFALPHGAKPIPAEVVNLVLVCFALPYGAKPVPAEIKIFEGEEEREGCTEKENFYEWEGDCFGWRWKEAEYGGWDKIAGDWVVMHWMGGGGYKKRVQDKKRGKVGKGEKTKKGVREELR